MPTHPIQRVCGLPKQQLGNKFKVPSHQSEVLLDDPYSSRAPARLKQLMEFPGTEPAWHCPMTIFTQRALEKVLREQTSPSLGHPQVLPDHFHLQECWLVGVRMSKEILALIRSERAL